MKIASFNVNGVNGRLNVLLRWLSETSPDIVCLQELKAPNERFPHRQINKAGYGAIWQGQKPGTVSLSSRKAQTPIEIRRSCPVTPTMKAADT